MVERGRPITGIFDCWKDVVLSQVVSRVPFPRHMKHRELFIRGGIVVHTSSRAGSLFGHFTSPSLIALSSLSAGNIGMPFAALLSQSDAVRSGVDCG